MNCSNTYFQKLLTSALFLTCFFSANGQLLQVTSGNTPPYTPQNLISNVFLGSGVDVTSITYTGDPIGVGYFSGGTQAIGLERGIVLTTGRAESTNTIDGANSVGNDFANNDNTGGSTQPDLTPIATGVLRDVAVYTIKFIPTSDTLRFRYCFASEEYPEFACSSFNDVFGFFIQGPGYPTPTNIAIIPGTTNLAVAINNLHPSNGSTCPALNDTYYNDNTNSNKQPVYDGFTDIFTAMAVVKPCFEYTIKLAIADVGDPNYDSGVFLEAKSFGTGSLKVDVATASADGTVTEGCSPGSVTFKLPDVQTQDFIIDYHIWGTATNGIDYQPIATNLVIPAGQQQIEVPVVGLEDNTLEGSEYLAIDVKRDPCHRDTIYVYLRDNAIINPALRPDTTFCLGNVQPLVLNATLAIPVPPPPTFSNMQDFNIAPVNTAIESPINVFGVQPANLEAGVIRSVCMNITHAWDDDLNIFLVSPGGQFVELSTDNGGNGDNYTNTCFTPTATTVISFPGPVAPASAAPFTGNWLPEGPWTDLWDNPHPSNGVWKLQVVDDQNGFAGTLNDWSITFEPSYKINYQWTPAAGLDCPTCPIVNATPAQTTNYIVKATDSYGCEVFDSVKIVVGQALLAPVVTCMGTVNNNMTFTWTDVVDATGYEVNVNGGGWMAPSGNKTHTVLNVPVFTVINLEVRAIGPVTDCPALIGTASCVNCQSPAVTIATTPVTCFGLNNGKISLTPDNLNPPYNFTINTTTNTTGNFANLPPGTYTALVVDPLGCDTTLQITVTTPQALAVSSAVQQNVTCFGGNNGRIGATVTGGTTPFTYKWSDPTGQTTPIAQNLPAGNYVVTITDANNCTSTATATITQPADLTLATTVSNAKCFGQPSGAIIANGGGGIPNYQYKWSNSVLTANNPNITAGTYTVTITDNNGCTEVSTAVVAQPTAISATIATTPPSCTNGANGSAIVTANGGVGNLNFKWSDPAQQTTATANNLSPLTYSVTITDGNACTLVQTATLTNPPPLGVSITATIPSCNGSVDGKLTAVGSGGVGSYTYKWSDPGSQTTAIASNLVAGAYTVTVTDQNGCTGTGNLNLSEPAILQIVPTVTDVNCFGMATGRIATVLTGGTAPYTYKWSSNETTQNLTNKVAGVYTVTVTDLKGCTATITKPIAEATEIAVLAQPTEVNCFGGSDGKIALTVSGGFPAYTAAWAGPDSYTGNGLTVNNLRTGNYTAIVSDNVGCSKTLTMQINQPATALALVVPAIADTICFLATNGTATAYPSGGTTPYSYQWNVNNITTKTATGLASGVYEVTIADAHGCTQQATTFIQQEPQIFGVAAAEKPRCYNGTDGSAKVIVVFYAANEANLNLFTYKWSTTPAQNTLEATGLEALKSYTVTITDALGCIATSTVTVGNPEPLEAVIKDNKSVLCKGDATGSALATGSGGSTPYTYLWGPVTGNPTDSLAQNLAAGTYRVTVTDARGCPAITSTIITEPTKLKSDFTHIDALCFGQSSGTAKVLPAGGTPPYTYVWFTGASTQEISSLPAGSYGVTLTDINGCRVIDSVSIRQPATPVRGTATVQDASCFGSYNGRITIAGDGGTPPYRYALDGANWNGSPLQIGLSAGNYVPRLIDKNGCEISLEAVEVKQLPAVTVDLGPDFTIILGQDTQLVAQVTNATGLVRYQWDLADSVWLSCVDCSNPSVYSLFRAHYFTVEVVDAMGCAASDQVLINVEKPRKIFVPTGFSPNGDGTNDLLLVHGQKNAKIVQFRVFDRWGEMVYEGGNFPTNDPNNGWDGNFRGSPLDPNIFVWIVEVEYLDGEREIFKGNTTLIR